jgi:transposase-like protein
MLKKGTKHKVYSAEFKKTVIETLRKEELSYCEIVRRFELGKPGVGGYIAMVQRWERIYLEEGEDGLMKERRGRASSEDGIMKGRPPKLEKQVEEDLIAENQRLRMENAYLKKLHALALAKKKLRNEIKPK